MSGLGELLLGKVKRDIHPSDKTDNDSTNLNNNQSDYDQLADSVKHDIPSPQKNDGRQNCPSQSIRTFPNRVERGERNNEDRQSNASSTDDYVHELLDPNDRPKNVWHVVEGPKRTSDDERGVEAGQNSMKRESILDEEPNHSTTTKIVSDISPRNAHTKSSHAKSESDPQDHTRPFDSERHDKRRSEDDRNGRSETTSRHRSRDKDSSSRHHSSRSHRDDRRDTKDRGHNQDDDRKRTRSSGRDRSDRRRDYSDDDDDHGRRHGRRESRHDSRKASVSRSRSRSPRSSASRRRDRSRSGSPRRNSRTIIVMQLSQRVVARDLEDYFNDNIGHVREVRLIMDGRTRRHKGVAYIEFKDSRSASKALTFDGRRLQGTPLMIQAVDSRSSEYHSSSTSSHHLSSRSNHHTSSSHPSSRSLPPGAYRVYVGALNTGITDEMLRTIVEPFGPVLRVEVIKDRSTGISRGYAFVTFASTEDGQEAVRSLDGFELAGKNMRVSKSTEKSEH